MPQLCNRGIYLFCCATWPVPVRRFALRTDTRVPWGPSVPNMVATHAGLSFHS
jgi:hypothetical protein